MKETSLKIRNRVTGLSRGQTEESMMETGIMGSNMARAFIIHRKEMSRKASGMKERDCIGFDTTI